MSLKLAVPSSRFSLLVLGTALAVLAGGQLGLPPYGSAAVEEYQLVIERAGGKLDIETFSKNFTVTEGEGPYYLVTFECDADAPCGDFLTISREPGDRYAGQGRKGDVLIERSSGLSRVDDAKELDDAQ